MGTWKTRLTKEDFIERARSKHGDKYDYSLVNYITNRTKVEIICTEHGPFWQEPFNHKNGSGCPACVKCKRHTLADFIAKSNKAHGNKYDYSKAVFKTVDTKLTIICPEHGEFEQIPFDHMRGHGCAKCGAKKCNNKRRHSIDKFIEQARTLHGDKFDYSKAVYKNSTTPIEIICPEHGSFWQVPQDHKTRYGCQSCAGLSSIPFEEFISRARQAHGQEYEYDKESYVAYRSHVKIICKKHGPFMQVCREHANGSGCPSCANESRSSREETEIAEWLESLSETVIRNDRKILAGLEIDVYLPERGVGIEYNGAYWHHEERMAHPRLHELKQNRAKKAGIRLVTVWDFDWKEKQEIIKRHILHAIGRSDGKRINARECTVRKIDYHTAKPFYDTNHIQGGPWRAFCHYGLFNEDNLVSCMSFGQGASRRGKVGDHEWELQRFATSEIVRGGASKLFKAFLSEHDPEVVWSFSDSQHFSGGVYPALWFENDGHVRADYRVAHVNKRKVWHKSAWKRKHIPARLAELGVSEEYSPESDKRTERDMQELAGVIRIMDAGKTRWKWTKKSA